jgi:hypothetical protein
MHRRPGDEVWPLATVSGRVPGTIGEWADATPVRSHPSLDAETVDLVGVDADESLAKARP